jgi:hypothetical protein
MRLCKIVVLFGWMGVGCLTYAASSMESLHAKIPLAFTFAIHEFAAGDYEIRENSDDTVFAYGNGHGAAMLSYPAALPESGSAPRLEFLSTGEKSYLMKVEGGEVIRAFPLHISEEKTIFAAH